MWQDSTARNCWHLDFVVVMTHIWHFSSTSISMMVAFECSDLMVKALILVHFEVKHWKQVWLPIAALETAASLVHDDVNAFSQRCFLFASCYRCSCWALERLSRVARLRTYWWIVWWYVQTRSEWSWHSWLLWHHLRLWNHQGYVVFRDQVV